MASVGFAAVFSCCSHFLVETGGLLTALTGWVTEHHRFLFKLLLDEVTALESEGFIERFETRIEQVMVPFAEAAQRLMTIPRGDRRVAEKMIAEIGTDKKVFASANHLASWVGVSPGNNESAGKQRSGRTTKEIGGCVRRWCRLVVKPTGQVA